MRLPWVGTRAPLSHPKVEQAEDDSPPVELRKAHAQRFQRHAEDACDLPQVQEGEVAFAPLGGADEGAVQTAALAQVGLRPSQFLAPPAEAATQLAEEVLLFQVHA